MIRERNLSEFKLEVSMPGNASTGVKIVKLIPYACQLKAIYAKSRTAGTTGTQTVDVLKNGTTIFSGGTLINQATGVATSTYGALTANPTTFVKGDQVSINVATVNTTPAVDWVAILTFQRIRNAQVGAMLTDTIGPEAE